MQSVTSDLSAIFTIFNPNIPHNSIYSNETTLPPVSSNSNTLGSTDPGFPISIFASTITAISLCILCLFYIFYRYCIQRQYHVSSQAYLNKPLKDNANEENFGTARSENSLSSNNTTPRSDVSDNKNNLYFDEDLYLISSLYPDHEKTFDVKDKMMISRVAREVMSNAQANHLERMYTRNVRNPMRLPNRPTTGGLFCTPG